MKFNITSQAIVTFLKTSQTNFLMLLNGECNKPGLKSQIAGLPPRNNKQTQLPVLLFALQLQKINKNVIFVLL